MNDFFGALELELRAAAGRSPRRRIPVGYAAGLVAAASLVAVALVAALVVLGGGEGPADVSGAPKPDPVGTVIPKGEGKPPREADSTVVATGDASRLGPWQMEVHHGKALRDPKTGELYNGAGPCLMVYALDPPSHTFTGSGYCGPGNLGFRKTPGFSRAQLTVPAQGRRADGTRIRVRRVFVFGRTPERATAVVITSPNVGVRAAVQEGPDSIRGDFYGIAVRPPMAGARINWLDEDGKPGSRGIRLMPPLTRR
jgi:hypothetical protein